MSANVLVTNIPTDSLFDSIDDFLVSVGCVYTDLTLSRGRNPKFLQATITCKTKKAAISAAESINTYQGQSDSKLKAIVLRTPRVAPSVMSSTKLFIANIPDKATEEELTLLLATPPVKEAKIIREKDNSSKGFGFLTFETEQDQILAFKKLSYATLHGRQLVVRVALELSN
eukprot:GHVN01047331.1.p1 GENE.GHVN01047331.1~~GHVN01047331.1.p1  ORF type:complete len:172 (-),score=14.52 GHVN01047331.1:18-533(-)